MAGETPWTRGPWHALDVDTASGLKIRGGGHHYPLAKACSYWDGPGPREDEAKANYRLIAAAPEMAEALRRCADQFGGPRDGDWSDLRDDDEIEHTLRFRIGDLKALRALLAKIGGAA